LLAPVIPQVGETQTVSCTRLFVQYMEADSSDGNQTTRLAVGTIQRPSKI